MRSARTLTLAGVAVAAFAFAMACRGGARGRTGSGGGPPGAPGVVLLVVDTLRADDVDIRGGSGLLPSLSSFAKGATCFADATSAASWTAPGVASILTGRIPSSHGVHGAHQAPALVDSVPTLAERFQTAGWATAGHTSGGWFGREFGLSRGFDQWSEDFDFVAPLRTVAAWRKDLSPDRPFFLVLHTYAAHDPYGPKGAGFAGDPAFTAKADAEIRGLLDAARAGGGPKRLAPDVTRSFAMALVGDPYAHDAYTRLTPPSLLSDLRGQLSAWIEGGWRTDADAHSIATSWRAAYERGLAWADRVVADTLAALSRAGLPEGTVVAIVSDHGEAFGEHGFLGHGADLHDEIVRVPLIVRAPGRLAPGVVTGSCGTVDVAPTLLSLAGLPPIEEIDGRSLLPLARGEESGWPVVSEALRNDGAGDRASQVRLASVRTTAAKYFVEMDARTGAVRSEALYDLRADPGELRALPPEHLARFGSAFCAAVGSLRARLAIPTASHEVCSVAH